MQLYLMIKESDIIRPVMNFFFIKSHNGYVVSCSTLFVATSTLQHRNTAAAVVLLM